MLRKLVPLLLLVAATAAHAETAAVSNLSDPSRWSLSASAGYLSFTDPSWSGGDIAAGVTYSAHQRLAVTGNLLYGLSTDNEKPNVAIARVQGQVRLYPPPESDAKAGLFASAGPAWSGSRSLTEWRGLNTQLAATYGLAPGVSAYAAFAHGFAWDGGDDLNYIRAGLSAGGTLGR